MSLKITCPRNAEHKEFITTAHEQHEWRVSSDGSFIRDLGCLQVTHKPEKGNEFTCVRCYATAIVEEV